MGRYKLGKTQVKRLLDGGYVMDGHGRKYKAEKNLKEVLQTIDELDAYDKYDLIIENGEFDLVRKEGGISIREKYGKEGADDE